MDTMKINPKETKMEYEYHVEVHTRRDGCHLEDVCEDYRTLADAEDGAAELSRDFADNPDYYCNIKRKGEVVYEKSCRDWCN